MLNCHTDIKPLQTLQDTLIVSIIILMWLLAPVATSATTTHREQTTISTWQAPQPKSGSLRERRFPKYVWRTNAGPEPQSVLNRRRRQFVNTLAPEHQLRKRSESRTGRLLPARKQPPCRPRDTSLNPETLRAKGKTKSRLDPSSIESILERSRLLKMWNGITERGVKEEEWQQFDRVKPKLLTLKRKHSNIEMCLEDEATLERKRARSRHRAERERYQRWKESCKIINDFLAMNPDDETGDHTVQQPALAKESRRKVLTPRTPSSNIVVSTSTAAGVGAECPKSASHSMKLVRNRSKEKPVDQHLHASPIKHTLQRTECSEVKNADEKELSWTLRKLDRE